MFAPKKLWYIVFLDDIVWRKNLSNADFLKLLNVLQPWIFISKTNKRPDDEHLGVNCLVPNWIGFGIGKKLVLFQYMWKSMEKKDDNSCLCFFSCFPSKLKHSESSNNCFEQKMCYSCWRQAREWCCAWVCDWKTPQCRAALPTVSSAKGSD